MPKGIRGVFKIGHPRKYVSVLHMYVKEWLCNYMLGFRILHCNWIVLYFLLGFFFLFICLFVFTNDGQCFTKYFSLFDNIYQVSLIHVQ